MVTETVQGSQDKSPLTSRVSPWLVRIAYPLIRGLVFPFFFKEIVVEGKENVPKEGAVIVAPTHRSRWDALIVPYATGRLVSGRDPHFMVSANEMKGIQGWFIRRLGGFPVNTERPELSSLTHTYELLTRGEMVVIFPEGGIFRTSEVQPLKRGLGKVAAEVAMNYPEVDLKILPVAIRYSEAIPRRGCRVWVRVGRGLRVSYYLADTPRQTSIRLTAALKEALDREVSLLPQL
ncbi:MAG: 1-acyl-sn-glycerol-3-phosphate acyltransferase [Geminocystis sp.]|nr:1-acyl-sn-glycerol-3-phosphate acyltransferase [Geminocystis sp.]HIK38333.1 1-acyl-sn-glycerol-3-phosphate acyltransferase [Geminocystis sp. M7585_C2015_104]MCS7148762.1 1-acyl-sn-glycerol-3-phosphate acyltransferase [Geminocystis sp.]MCX8078364.1 1-acyl-sn-glycerol-3-phosphate acyltransferase [Geminocystis sp.]MDW8116089.1 1-acyl-sn-glycerol-3-phosphate acyltransferase [Geminocystis sp.]